MKKSKAICTLIFFVLLIVGNLIAQNKDPKIKLRSSEDRAKLLHYKALKHFEDNKVKKAKRKLRKAIRMHASNQYLVDLASIYESEGKYKKALNTVQKLVPNDYCSDLTKVKLISDRANYAMYLGLGIPAHETYGAALRKFNLHQIDSSLILSDLYNNYGVSKLFYNTGKDTSINIHVRDILMAREYFQTALKNNEDNCMAQHNVDFVDALLKGIQWDSITGTPKYLRPSNIAHIDFPEMNCDAPERIIKENIIRYLNKEKEVVFVLDISLSMNESATNAIPRIEAMKELVIGLIDDLDEGVKIGLITLGQDCDAPPMHEISIGNKASREELKSIVHNLDLNGCTPLNKRLRQATKLFTKSKNDKAIFLCSDGVNYCGNKNSLNRESSCKVGGEIGKKGIKIYAFSLLLETDESYQEYAIYDCITKASYGELIGITETGHTVKSASMDEPFFSLPLKREDLMTGKFKFPEFKKNDLVYQD